MSREEVVARCDGVARTFGKGPRAVVALQATTCEIVAGERIALTGPSGSGKSTLLHLLAGLDDPSLGTISWPAIGPRDALRPGRVGMVFQGPSLLPPLTVAENVALPLLLAGRTEERAREGARAALERLGLGELFEKLPEEISGGQAQRVAVARALTGAPLLLLADEPTGQLDHGNAAEVVDVLEEAARHSSAALVVATHDPEVAERLPQHWVMRDGRLAFSTSHRVWLA
jgi:putative ABC transport system ATP-binding protein/lipoprotein-releasing system ATP-binding protein